jgi:hypothetical protein
MADDRPSSRHSQSFVIGSVENFVNNPENYHQAGRSGQPEASRVSTRPVDASAVDVFITHRHSEVAVVKGIAAAIRDAFRDPLALYVSAVDPPELGEDWFHEIDRALRSARLQIAIVGPGSMASRWIHFESGFAWARGIPVVFLCYGGIRPDQLPLPYGTRMGLELLDPKWLFRLVETLKKHVRSQPQNESVIEALEQKLRSELADALQGLTHQ